MAHLSFSFLISTTHTVPNSSYRISIFDQIACISIYREYSKSRTICLMIGETVPINVLTSILYSLLRDALMVPYFENHESHAMCGATPLSELRKWVTLIKCEYLYNNINKQTNIRLSMEIKSKGSRHF